MEKEKFYVVMTDDGPQWKDVFLSWDAEYSYYTTVEYVDEINEYDIHNSIEAAIARAKDADSSTLGGWKYEMKVMEVLNFEDAREGCPAELKEIQTIVLD
jgi:hypothetical protein